MTIDDMVKACLSAMAHGGSAAVAFVLPGRARGRCRRLFGRSGPTGEVLAGSGTDDKPETLVAFDPAKVLAYLTAKGWVDARVVQIDGSGGGTITITRNEGDGP